MTHDTAIADRIRRVFDPSQRGVVGVVDDLLAFSRDHSVALDYHDASAHVRTPDGAIDVPLPKSAFRAILARIAALCNEAVPNSVTPYHGDGTVTVGDPPTSCHVSFTNTPAEQRLELRPIAGTANGKAHGATAIA